MTRRELLERLATVGMGLAAALAAVVPSLWSVVGLARRQTVGGGDEFIGLGPLQSFPEHEPQSVVLQGTLRDAWSRQEGVALGSVWVVRSAGGVAAFSAICPHLGCSIGYDPGGARFVCPCHGSVFGPDGAVRSGPSPRGLDPLPTRITPQGEVACRYLRFKPGLANREPI
jgi:menaquinol-cytochrome c reductase iron-sulfur subunit